jgi:hypothetical protein
MTAAEDDEVVGIRDDVCSERLAGRRYAAPRNDKFNGIAQLERGLACPAVVTHVQPVALSRVSRAKLITGAHGGPPLFYHAAVP